MTTGSWLGKKKKADVAIAVNPLYQDNANAGNVYIEFLLPTKKKVFLFNFKITGSNPLFEGE